jgi:hypothetical protein
LYYYYYFENLVQNSTWLKKCQPQQENTTIPWLLK